MAKTNLDQFDKWLQDDGPAAIVFRRKFKPVEGKDSWIFPPTFAQSESNNEDEEGSGGVYQIDELVDDIRRNVCMIDSIGSQANRMEPIFKKPPYSSLVPQVTVRLKNSDEVNLLDAGHRAADAVIRFSKTLGPKLWDAFGKYRATRDCTALARLAPTSLIFGVWDSRATGAKIQRIVRSVIRAYNVTKAKRSATYQAAYDYTGNEVIKPERDKGTGKDNPLSQEGFKYSLATGTHGGVLVKGEIVQEALINLVALRMLTNDLQAKRYLLSLALVALSYRDQQGFNLREGCLLAAETKNDFDGAWKAVNFDGTEKQEHITHDGALAYAQGAAEEFKVENPPPDEFDQNTADSWLGIEKKKRKTLAKTKHPAKAVADEEAAATKKKTMAGLQKPSASSEDKAAQ
jgi:CRISPR-associated protein Csb1